MTRREAHCRRRGRTSKWIRRARREAIYARDGGLCLWCGGPAEALDHAVPRCRGGTHASSNLLSSCFRCNSRRRDRSLPAFAEYLGGDWQATLRRVRAARRRKLRPRRDPHCDKPTNQTQPTSKGTP